MRIAIIAILAVLILKMAAKKLPVPGLKQLADAV
jgi:hypothetical protein